MMQRKSNLKEELKLLMFPISGPICISDDEALFQNIMTTFYQHEQYVRREGEKGGKEGKGRESEGKECERGIYDEYPNKADMGSYTTACVV